MKKLVASLPLFALSLCTFAHPVGPDSDSLKLKSKTQASFQASSLNSGTSAPSGTTVTQPGSAPALSAALRNSKPATPSRPQKISLIRPAEDTISAKDLKAINAINDTALVLAEDVPMPVDENSIFENELYNKRLDSLQREIPLTYNQYVQSYIDLYAYHRRHLVERLLGEGTYYFPIFEKALKQVGIPDQLKYLSIIESQLNPVAVSRVGATGLWQFMFTTGKIMGLQMNSNIDERRDPAKASLAAARYLKESYDYYGDWLLVIASYNCGNGNVDRAIRKAGGARSFWAIQRFLPKETRSYVPAFIAATYIFSYAKQHGLHASIPDFSVQNDTVMLNNRVALNSIASGLGLDADQLRKLNPQYKRGFIDASADQPMEMVLPLEKKALFVASRDKILSAPADMNVYQAGYTENEVKTAQKVMVHHKVKRGETLSGIADRYDVTVQDLKVWNHLHRLAVSAGQNLKIKKTVYSRSRERESYTSRSSHSSRRHSSASRYKVKRGDTLSTIAEKLNMPMSKLRSMNRLHGNSIRPGQSLKV